jgi:hypothetical protein
VPGKGCQSCYDMAEIVAAAVRAERQRIRMAAAVASAIMAAVLWLVTR